MSAKELSALKDKGIKQTLQPDYASLNYKAYIMAKLK